MARTTPLYERHQELGARMVEFGGFMMPVQYSGIIEEHKAVRERAGIFDISHMGEIEVTGSDALAFLERMVTRRLSGLRKGRLAYGILCNDEGGIIDDLTVYRREASYYLVVNAATAESDFRWLVSHRDEWGMEAEIRDLSADTGKIDVQGPAAAELARLAGIPETESIRYFSFIEVPGREMLVSRSGYTGEDGFEFYLPAGETPGLWDALLDAGGEVGGVPCGLGARDTLRLEACLVLNGSDIGLEYNPFRAGLGWAVDLSKDELVGVEALRSAARKVKEDEEVRVLTPFVLEGRSSARHGDGILCEDAEAGVVTSGSFSPTLEKAVGMGYIAKAKSIPGTAIEVEVRKRRLGGVISERPLYSRD